MTTRRFVSTLLGALVLFNSAVSQSADDFSGDVSDVRVVRRFEQHPGSNLIWEPYIAAWSGKQLVVAYGVGMPGKVDMGDIAACVSTDDGNTWSEPVLVFDHNQRQGTVQFAYANPVLYKPPGQDVVFCYAMRCPVNFAHSEDSQLAAAYSGDGGRSWTPIELTMHYTGPLIVVAGIHRIEENGQPLYLFPAHRNTRRNDPLGTREQFILSSTSLLEWRMRGYVPRPETPSVFIHEGNLAFGDVDGPLKLVMRTCRHDKEGVALDPPRAYSSTSNDGGRTWTTAQAEPDLWNSVSKGYYGRSTDGRHVYVYSDGPAWTRMALRYKVQGTDGKWSSEQTFYDAQIHNSYPTLVEVAPNEYRAVWDSGTKDRHRTHIHFGKFKLPAN